MQQQEVAQGGNTSIKQSQPSKASNWQRIRPVFSLSMEAFDLGKRGGVPLGVLSEKIHCGCRSAPLKGAKKALRESEQKKQTEW